MSKPLRYVLPAPSNVQPATTVLQLDWNSSPVATRTHCDTAATTGTGSVLSVEHADISVLPGPVTMQVSYTVADWIVAGRAAYTSTIRSAWMHTVSRRCRQTVSLYMHERYPTTCISTVHFSDEPRHWLLPASTRHQETLPPCDESSVRQCSVCPTSAVDVVVTHLHHKIVRWRRVSRQSTNVLITQKRPTAATRAHKSCCL